MVYIMLYRTEKQEQNFADIELKINSFKIGGITLLGLINQLFKFIGQSICRYLLMLTQKKLQFKQTLLKMNEINLKRLI